MKVLPVPPLGCPGRNMCDSLMLWRLKGGWVNAKLVLRYVVYDASAIVIVG